MLKPTNILRRLLALCLCLLLAAGSACAEKPVLLTFDTEEIPTCDLILPDGRLILSEIPTEKDVNLFCLNTDRTVSWKYSISVKDVHRIFDISPTPEYSSLYHMSVMSDGTIGVWVDAENELLDMMGRRISYVVTDQTFYVTLASASTIPTRIYFGGVVSE